MAGGWFDDLLESFGDGLSNAGKNALGYFSSGEGIADLIGAGAGYLLTDFDKERNVPVGYQGKVPEMDAVRGQVPMMRGTPNEGGGVTPIDQSGIAGIHTPRAAGQVNMGFDPNRRPGSSGRRYFTDTQFVNKGDGADVPAGNMNAAVAARDAQAAQLREKNIGNLARQRRNQPRMPSEVQPMAIGGQVKPQGIEALAANAARPRPKMPPRKPGGMLPGATDGMADKVPASVDGKKQTHALSDGEFVIPADVVSALGNGNSEAGAEALEGMMDKVRKAKTGSEKQPPAINASALMPK